MIHTNLEKIILESLHQTKLMKVNEKITLTVQQIEILRKYQIPYESCNSINEIIFYIEEILEVEEYEDLESVSSALAELDYYQNYRK